jgi:hypothetical protein
MSSIFNERVVTDDHLLFPLISHPACHIGSGRAMCLTTAQARRVYSGRGTKCRDDLSICFPIREHSYCPKGMNSIHPGAQSSHKQELSVRYSILFNASLPANALDVCRQLR